MLLLSWMRKNKIKNVQTVFCKAFSWQISLQLKQDYFQSLNSPLIWSLLSLRSPNLLLLSTDLFLGSCQYNCLTLGLCSVQVSQPGLKFSLYFVLIGRFCYFAPECSISAPTTLGSLEALLAWLLVPCLTLSVVRIHRDFEFCERTCCSFGWFPPLKVGPARGDLGSGNLNPDLFWLEPHRGAGAAAANTHLG